MKVRLVNRFVSLRLSWLKDYQMTMEVAKGQASPLDNVEQTRQNLQGLERSIKALGQSM